MHIVQSGETYSAIRKSDVRRYEIAPNGLIPISHQRITCNVGEQKT